MVCSPAPRSFRLHKQPGAATRSRRQASDRLHQSEPNLEGCRSSLGHFWFHPLPATARDRPKDCHLGIDSGGRVGGVLALLDVAPTSARCSYARCRLEAKPQSLSRRERNTMPTEWGRKYFSYSTMCTMQYHWKLTNFNRHMIR